MGERRPNDGGFCGEGVGDRDLRKRSSVEGERVRVETVEGGRIGVELVISDCFFKERVLQRK